MCLLHLADLFGLRYKKTSNTHGGEYHSACPECGGNDRFWFHPGYRGARCIGSYKCRQCQIGGDTISFAMKYLNNSKEEAYALVGLDIEKHEHYILPKKELPRLELPPKEWLENARVLVEESHLRLLEKPNILAYLEHRGLNLDAVKRFKLGWNNANLFLKYEDWGLKKEFKENGAEKILWIPEGLVIPHIDRSGIVLRMKVRLAKRKDASGVTVKDGFPPYIYIPGNMKGMWCFGYQPATCFVVESELDAMTINFFVGNTASCIATGSAMSNPDMLADLKAKKASLLVICHDNDEVGEKAWLKWKRMYPKAQKYPTTLAKDFGDSIRAGMDAKEFLEQVKQNLNSTLKVKCQENA
jgi:DNA primase